MMFSFRTIFKYLWFIIRPYRLAFFTMFFLVLLRIFFSLLLIPYVYKSIIDILSLNSIDVATRSHAVLFFLVPMVAGYLGSLLSNRYREFINLRFKSSVTKDIYDFSFLKPSNHSYKFYADNFSGSLVAKVKRFVRAFEVISDTILGTFWFIIVLIISSAAVLYFQSKILATYLIVWSILYAFFVLLFVKQKIQLDVNKAESDSRITGVLADAITNILNIKIFSAFNKEFSYFKKFSNSLRDRL